MVDEIAIVHTVAQTAGGNQDITHADITDFSGCIIILNGATSLGADAPHARMMVGFSDELGNQACSARRSEDANASVPETVTWGSNDRAIVIPHPTATSSTAPTLIGTGTVIARSVSGIANGFRITWDDTPDAAYRMTIILFGGTANLVVAQANVPTTPTLENIGFEPDLVFFHSQHGNYGGGPAAATLDYDSGLGAAVNDGSETQASLVLDWETLTEPTVTESYLSTLEGLGELNGGVAGQGIVTAFSASGFTWDSNGSSIPAQYLALEFTDVRTAMVVVETLPGTTGNQAFTGLGFRPELVLAIATLVTTEDAVLAASPLPGSEAICAFTESEEYSHSAYSEQGLTIANPPTSNAQSHAENEALYLPDDAGVVAAEATFVSMDELGFTLNFSTATAGRMIVIGIAALPQAIDETEEIAEEVGRFAGQELAEVEEIPEETGRFTGQAAAVEVEELSEEVLAVVTNLDLPAMDQFTTKADNAQAGAERGRNAFAGSEAGDDGDF